MLITDREVDLLKNRFPKGTRIELLSMEDAGAPPIGTLGTVCEVNCIGDLEVKWDNGSTLSVVYKVDRVKKIKEEDR